MTRLDTSEFDDRAFGIIAAALAVAEKGRLEDRRRLHDAVNEVARHDRTLLRAMTLFSMAMTCSGMVQRLADAQGVEPQDVLGRYRENLMLARLEHELDWPEDVD